MPAEKPELPAEFRRRNEMLALRCEINAVKAGSNILPLCGAAIASSMAGWWWVFGLSCVGALAFLWLESRYEKYAFKLLALNGEEPSPGSFTWLVRRVRAWFRRSAA